ncbi:MAG: flagellar basal body rod protein FlgC [Gammaproteobacteria bacterium]|nr:flagellar basal body rod protein FlgC [Gammaproteobacteria bacterium]
MSLFKIFDTAATALAAQSVRMNVTASNMANADTISSSVNETYRARYPVFQAVLREQMAFGDDHAAEGVRVLGIVEGAAPPRAEYRPDHPQADDEGYIFRPNINMVEQMTDMISASRSFQSNIEVINASKQMMQRTLQLGQG